MLEWIEQILHWLEQILYRVDALAIPLGILYVLLNRRARHRLRNARLASALLVELYYIRDELTKIIDSTVKMEKMSQAQGQHDFMQYDYEHLFQRNVYDGLVSSSNIAYFDRRIQKRLHAVYYAVRWFSKDISRVTHAGVTGLVISNKKLADDVLGSADKAIQAVEVFRDCNQYRGRWFPVLKAIDLAHDD